VIKPLLLLCLLALAARSSYAGILERGKVQLICHRTANRDAPENTLESLALAARMGCNIVEVDVRRTLDGTLVLNHDDLLERLTNGMGNVELTSSDELALIETGTWMGERFPRLRIPHFDEALRVAREQGIGLYLDIKTKGIGPQILAELEREGMLQRVIFGGESSDVRSLYPAANADPVASLGPDSSSAQVEALHRQGKFVVANFSETPHEMDLDAMRGAVAAGVDAINIDYPRIGADAVGRPVEAKLGALAKEASTGSTATRTAAIRELSRYYGFPTQPLFVRLLHDSDDQVSRAAVVALVRGMPAAPAQVFIDALSAKEKTARQNAAWALGITNAPATVPLLPLLKEKDPQLLKEALLALSRCPGDVSADVLLPFLASDTLTVRGAAALALARHQPKVAAKAIPELLHKEERQTAQDYAQYLQRGKPQLTQKEIDPILETYREQMKLIHSLEQLSPQVALDQLTAQAFRPTQDFSLSTGLVAGYQVWDRIAANPTPAIQALGSTDITVANRAEWVLVKADPTVLPAVRAAIAQADSPTRARLIRVLAWQGDRESLALLRSLSQKNPQDRELIDWAIQKIESLNLPMLEGEGLNSTPLEPR
jgi:glycerophosphoryl diester phosphodiesterase